MNKPQQIGHLKSGEAVYKYPESELSPYCVEKDYRYLVLPTEAELAEIEGMVAQNRAEKTILHNEWHLWTEK